MLNPTPVVMVSCGSTLDEYNIITIAWAGTVCSDPPMCSISVRPERHSYGIIKKEGPVHVSNVMVICPSCGKPTRVGHKVVVNGDTKTKVRVCKKCGADIKTPIDR